MKVKKKENILIIALLILMILAIIGVSYAAFSFSKIGTKVNSITTGSITMSYEESDNTITLSGALPTTDETGKKRLNTGEYFDFTVSSKIVGDVNINYEISAKDVTASSKKIDGSNIKLYLTRLTDNGEEELMSPNTYTENTSENSYTGRPSGEMSLYQGSMSSSETNKYRLRMWVDEEYNPQGDGGSLAFSVKINVYGKDGDKMPIQTGPVDEVLLDNIPEDNLYDDGVDTFITGEDPNNYIWYSGKLWRAVSINNEAKTTKLVTQWTISSIGYDDNSNAFEGSYIESWLNDKTVDGFLENLREPEKFIVMNAKWDATVNDKELGSITRPNGTTVVTDAVGLLNAYEYQTSYTGTTYSNGYLNNALLWYTLTPSGDSTTSYVIDDGTIITKTPPDFGGGVRPSINLKSDVKIVSGDGTETNPYRLEGDNDSNLRGTLLNTRYSGEYVRFGTEENNLYRIVSHETSGLTKITSAEPLREEGQFKKDNFGGYTFLNSTIGQFLNGEYLTSGEYLIEEQINMIEDNTTWYLGTVPANEGYKLAKYTDTTGTTLTSDTVQAKVGLLRYGELMAGQFDIYTNTYGYWLLTPRPGWDIYLTGWHVVGNNSQEYTSAPFDDGPLGTKPVMNLKSNVVITGGNGTKENPFEIELR